MTTHTNTTDAPLGAWYEDFYATVDAMDAAGLAARCTEETVMRMANHDAVVGRDAVIGGLSAFWSTIAAMRHEFVCVLEDGDTAAIEAIVHYTRRDGSLVSIPAATIIRRERGLVAEQRIYIDLAPLHA